MKYEILCSLLLRDKFWFTATEARSMAEKFAAQARDLAQYKFDEASWEKTKKESFKVK